VVRALSEAAAICSSTDTCWWAPAPSGGSMTPHPKPPGEGELRCIGSTTSMT